MSADDQWKQAYHALFCEQSKLNEEGQRMAAFVARYGREYIDAVDVLSERVAALESVLRAMVSPARSTGNYIDWTMSETRGVAAYICTYCGQSWEVEGPEHHAADCPVARARALFAGLSA